MRKMLINCAFLILIHSFLFATKDQIGERYLRHSLQSVALFEGDKYGDFTNDFVAVLNDGSIWKVHPKDRHLFSQWNVGDEIRVRVRTSFYWFKREHKFELVNHVRNESVRAMIVQYGDCPLKIMECHSKVIGSRMVAHKKVDAWGHIQYYYRPTIIYKTVFQLNDETQWMTEGEEYFTVEEKVYIFVDQEDGSFILITGLEREGAWQKITPVVEKA